MGLTHLVNITAEALAKPGELVVGLTHLVNITNSRGLELNQGSW